MRFRDAFNAIDMELPHSVTDLAELKSLPVRPLELLVRSGAAKGVWLWEAGSATTTDDAMVAACASGPAGRYKRQYDAAVVWIDWFMDLTNPMQSMLNFFGAAGGAVIVGNQEYAMPGVATSAANLRNLRISGMGTKSALVYSVAGGALTLTLSTPSGTEFQQDQLVVENVAFLTTFYSAAGLGNGTGTAINASWATAVGDKSKGATFRNVQFLPKNHNISAGQYARWDRCIVLDNGRQSTIDNCAFGGGALQNDGYGVELRGGSIPTYITNCDFSDLDKGVYAHGVTEGVYVSGGAQVNCNIGVDLNGNLAGSAETNSTTSITIGTGSKTFTVTDPIGVGGLAWTTPNQGLVIRDLGNPTVNFMIGAITSYTPSTVTVNVTSIGGAGTISSWVLSPEHYISDVKVHDLHSSCVISHVRASWAAFMYYHDNMVQKREGTSQNYIDVELVQRINTTFIHNNHFQARASGGTEDGVVVRNANGNAFINIHNNWIANRDRGVLIESGAVGCIVHDNYSIGDVTTLVQNDSAANKLNHIKPDFDILATDARQAFGANDATPSVASQGKKFFYTANAAPTTITQFDDAVIGQEWTLIINDVNTTLTHSATLLLKDAFNYAPSLGTIMHFVQEGITYAREIGRLPSVIDIFNNIRAGGYIRPGITTVAALTAAGTVGVGAMMMVTDATLTTAAGIGTAVIGGGVNTVQVTSNGVVWYISG